MPESSVEDAFVRRAAALAARLRRMGRGWQEGLVFFAMFVFVIVATVSTGRFAMAHYRRPHTDSLWRWYPAAVWRDLVESLPYLSALTVAALLVLIILHHARTQRRQTPPRPRLGLQTSLFGIGFVTWLSAVSFCEAFIQRGTLPVWHDFMGGMDKGFLSSALSNFTYARYVVPALVVWPIIFYALMRFGHWVRQRAWHPLGFTLAFAGACFCFASLSRPVHAPRMPLPRVLVDTPGVNDPFGRFLRSVAMALSGAPTQPREILEQAGLFGHANEGAALLGLPRAKQTQSCLPHPWASPLDEGSTPLGSLSQTLFTDNARSLENLLMFQISLESFRGDDLAALNPNAPRVLAPFLNSLYESADNTLNKDGGAAVIAAKDLWQGGVRTSQGLSAFACGMGALPHGISLVRDFGQVPLRCLSDVLVDAGFEGLFAYGSDPRFDNMQPFLAYHGFSRWISESTLPKGLPLGEWGAVSDRALMQHTLQQVASAQPHPTLALMMTLSNHSPFEPPEDLPKEVKARVQQALASRPNRAKTEDRPRLTTYAYTDFAVEEFFQQLNSVGLAHRSIVILHADHATGERFVWKRPDGSDPMTEAAKARIPFIVVFPEALLEKSADRFALRKAVAAAHTEINAAPTSLNDVPRWLLALLSHHPGIKGLPISWRWHSLGGMTASPAFAASQRPGARLWGINGINQLFFLDAGGQLLGQLEDVMTLTNPDELFTATRPLFAVSALWSGFLRDYARRCANVQSIRMRL